MPLLNREMLGYVHAYAYTYVSSEWEAAGRVRKISKHGGEFVSNEVTETRAHSVAYVLWEFLTTGVKLEEKKRNE